MPEKKTREKIEKKSAREEQTLTVIIFEKIKFL